VSQPHQHTVKYSAGCLCLINAIQCAAMVKGASVTITEEAATSMAVKMAPREFRLFDIQHAGPKTFTVTLKP
jgi:hypothetical protein